MSSINKIITIPVVENSESVLGISWGMTVRRDTDIVFISLSIPVMSPVSMNSQEEEFSIGSSKVTL